MVPCNETKTREIEKLNYVREQFNWMVTTGRSEQPVGTFPVIEVTSRVPCSCRLR